MSKKPPNIAVVDDPAWLLDPPSLETPAPPVVSRQQVLPLQALSWPDFEKLCLRLSRLDGRPEHWQLYGAPGQAQGGIDIFVRQSNSDRYVVWQSKRHRRFDASKVKSAVRKFMEGPWAERADRFVLCTSASLTETGVADAVEEAAATLRARNIVFDPRGDEKLSELLKDEPAIVDDFFDRPWVRAFCGADAATALGRRLPGREFGDLRGRLGDLYKAHFAAVDPGVLRAAAVSAASQTPLPLAVRFVPPDLMASGEGSGDAWITTTPRPPPRDPDTNESLADVESWAGTAGVPRRRDPRTTSLVTWSQDLDRAVIVGPPGAGKSTLLRFLALDMLAVTPRLPALRELYPGRLPVWISFPFWTRQIKRHGAGTQVSVQGVITAWLEAQGESALAQTLSRAIDDSRVVLLVDGIDEWVDEASAATAVTLLQTFVDVRKLPVVVTSRPHGARLLASLDGSWKRFELAPLSNRQQVDFATAWFEHLLPAPADPTTGAARARQRAEGLVAEIQRTPQIVPLAEVPLMLGGLLALSMSGASLPRSRFRAYQELCGRLLESHPLARGRAALVSEDRDGLDPSTRERVLAGLAYEVQSNPTPDSSLDAIRISAAQAFCRDFLIDALALPIPDATQRAQQLINVSEEAIGVLVRKSPEEIGFLHRAFQEFLAAKHITSFTLSDQIELMNAHSGDPRWRDVLLFVVEATTRADEVDGLVTAIETARQAGAGLDWSATILLADITFGEARRAPALTQRLADDFFRLVEAGPDMSERIEVLRRVVMGLSNEQTAVLIRPKLTTWFPSWSSYNRRDTLRLMAEWAPDPAVDDVLWRNLQDDLAQLRLIAANSLAIRCAGQELWRSRLEALLRTTSFPGVAAAALRAIVRGWPEHPSTKTIVDACAASDDAELALAGIAARVELGDRRDEDRDRLIEWVNGGNWGIRDSVVAPLAKGWAGDSTLKQRLIELHTDRRLVEDATLVALATAFPQDDDVADLFKKEMSGGRGFSGRHELFDILAKNFRGHPKMAELVDETLMENSGQTYELAKAAAIAPTTKIREAILATLEKPEYLIFWSVDTLLDEWSMDDGEVAAALQRITAWPPETLSEVADRVPDIFDGPTALAILKSLLAQSDGNFKIRPDKILAGLRKLGVTETDSSFVDEILKFDLFADYYVASMTAVALVNAYPNDPRVIVFAHRALHHADELISVVTLMMQHNDDVRRDILSVAAPLPGRLREALVPMLQSRATEDPFSRNLLDEGQSETDGNVISASAIATARTRVARDEVDDAYIELLDHELRAIGPRMSGRRLGAFAACAIVGRLDLVEKVRDEPGFDIGLVWRHRENRLAYAAVAENWSSVTQTIPLDRLMELLRLTPDEFVSRFAEYADQAPEIRPALAEALDQGLTAGKFGANSLRYLAAVRPRSRELLDRCVTLLATKADNWTEVELQLTAAELTAQGFAGDPEVLAKLLDIMGSGVRSAALAAICDGWPSSEALETIFDDVAKGRREGDRLNNAAILKLVASKSGPVRVVQNLAQAASNMTGGIWDAIPFWLPNVLKRIQDDDLVAQGLYDHLSAAGTPPSEAISFASLLSKARGVTPQLEAWCRAELARTRDEPVGVFAFDLWLGETTPARARLIDLLRAEG
jgi:hypothetical protein